MDASIRRRALEAAAKVALSVTSLAGCGGTLAASVDDTHVTTDAASPAVVDSAPEAGFCGSPPLGSSIIAEVSTVRCCKSYLQQAADASMISKVGALPETGACCSAILSFCRGPGLLPECAFYDEVSQICCPLLQNPNVPFCGPWGPPMPPAMPRSFVEGMA